MVVASILFLRPGHLVATGWTSISNTQYSDHKGMCDAEMLNMQNVLSYLVSRTQVTLGFYIHVTTLWNTFIILIPSFPGAVKTLKYVIPVWVLEVKRYESVLACNICCFICTCHQDIPVLNITGMSSHCKTLDSWINVRYYETTINIKTIMLIG